jgi:hypothetical protein
MVACCSGVGGPGIVDLVDLNNDVTLISSHTKADARSTKLLQALSHTNVLQHTFSIQQVTNMSDNSQPSSARAMANSATGAVREGVANVTGSPYDQAAADNKKSTFPLLTI